jgi:hypothetical protein
MEAICSFETLGSLQTTWYDNPKTAAIRAVRMCEGNKLVSCATVAGRAFADVATRPSLALVKRHVPLLK